MCNMGEDQVTLGLAQARAHFQRSNQHMGLETTFIKAIVLESNELKTSLIVVGAAFAFATLLS